MVFLSEFIDSELSADIRQGMLGCRKTCPEHCCGVGCRGTAHSNAQTYSALRPDMPHHSSVRGLSFCTPASLSECQLTAQNR